MNLGQRERYRCVRTRPWDATGWVYFVIRELRIEGKISSRSFTRLTISLEIGPKYTNGLDATDS